MHFNESFSWAVRKSNPIIQIPKPNDTTTIRKRRNIQLVPVLWCYYITMHIRSIASGKKNTSIDAYSCSRIVSGDLTSAAPRTCGNLVFLRISITSEFLRSSSPSFSPEVKWQQTKQKVVWCKDMLMDIDPCSKMKTCSVVYIVVTTDNHPHPRWSI